MYPFEFTGKRSKVATHCQPKVVPRRPSSPSNRWPVSNQTTHHSQYTDQNGSLCKAPQPQNVINCKVPLDTFQPIAGPTQCFQIIKLPFDPILVHHDNSHAVWKWMLFYKYSPFNLFNKWVTRRRISRKSDNNVDQWLTHGHLRNINLRYLIHSMQIRSNSWDWFRICPGTQPLRPFRPCAAMNEPIRRTMLSTTRK